MKRNYPVVFLVSVEQASEPLVIFKIKEGLREYIYELDAAEAITTGSQMIQAAHEVRKRNK